MPFNMSGEYNPKTGTKKLTIEYHSERLKIIKYDAPADFSKFLDAVKKGVKEVGGVSISYLGHGAGHIETEHNPPKYETLDRFLRNRTDTFFKIAGTITLVADGKQKPEDFYIESEISKFTPHNLRLYSEPEVAKQLELLLK